MNASFSSRKGLGAAFDGCELIQVEMHERGFGFGDTRMAFAALALLRKHFALWRRMSASALPMRLVAPIAMKTWCF